MTTKKENKGARMKAWREANPEKVKAYREKYKVLATTGDGYLFAIYRVGYVSTVDL
jgi:hypothetical protein